MNKLPNLIPVSDLRQNAAAVLDKVASQKGVTVITQRGRAAAVLLSIEAYEKAEYERQLLLRLAAGEREVAAGQGVDLDQVMAEAEALLAEPAEE
jgi:prevent-host-death family protein